MTAFKKKFKLELVEEKENVSNNKIKEWFSKWDRTIAAFTALIVFCALLTLVIVNIKVFNNDSVTLDEDVTSNPVNNMPSLLSLSSYASSCVLKEGPSTWSCTDSENLQEAINSIIEMSGGKNAIDQLHLERIRFKNNQIEEGWLKGTNLTFGQLTILPLGSNQVIRIGKNAFNGEPFGSLNHLTLRQITISNGFRKEMFQGLYLTTLEISCTGYLNPIEDNALEAIATGLQTLQLQTCLSANDGDLLTKITGSNGTMPNLKLLDLRDNTLTKITATSFKSVPNVESLYLSSSNIMEIEMGAFDLHSLQTLELTSNKLTTLPENIFLSVGQGIAITNNAFMCDCNLVWLKHFLEENKNRFNPPSFDCYTSSGNVIYSQVNDFCQENTSDFPILSSSSTFFFSETTTVGSSSEVVRCIEPIDLEKLNIEVSSLDKLGSISVRKESINMEFNYCRYTQKYILIITGDKVDYQNLLWINAENKTEMYCVKPLNSGIQIELGDLPLGNTYIFCAMTPEVDTVSPLDCGAWSVPLPPEDETWDETYKIYFICGICGSFFLAALVSGLIVFYCIRQHPSLIKGNKRVIIVESEAADAIVMPKTYYDEISYKPPSLNSRSNGYLTPRNNAPYGRARNGAYVRTISENTDFVLPSTSGMGRTKRSHYKRRTRLEQVTAFDDHVYEPPPPLPPNHPLGSNFSSLNRTYSRV